MNKPTEIAQQNFEKFRQISYHGRGLIQGADETGQFLVQICWAESRSEFNRNRIYCVDGPRLFTDIADPSKLKKDQDTSLILYNAMKENEKFFIVSNGEQTDAVAVETKTGWSFDIALLRYSYEPDSGHTPRITGICGFTRNMMAEFNVIRKSPWDTSCQRFFYRYEHIAEGFGYGISTYAEDGSPPPSFAGEPLLLPLQGGIATVAETYWQALNEANRICLAVKFIPRSGQSSTIHHINRYLKIRGV